jgi:hypothetical protein
MSETSEVLGMKDVETEHNPFTLGVGLSMLHGI